MHAGLDSVAAASHGSTTGADTLDSLQPVDLTVSCGTLHQRLPPVRRYWQKRTVRRNKVKPQDTERFIEDRNEENMMDADTPAFTFISGPRYVFQRFIRQYPVAALAVWTALFLVEMALVVVYIVQSTRNDMPTWVYYDLRAYSNFFYAQVALSLISLLQLLFAYSLSVMTIIVVVSTSIYQCIIFFIALAPSLAWVSRLYVPFFLRCWPMRQYFLFVLDSIALMLTRNQKLDLLRLGISTLTFFLCLVFTAASLFQIDQSFNGAYLNLGVAIYFTITTITTVGFGDVTPKTADGKALTIVIIFVFLAKMPTFIQVIRSMAKILRALRSYQGRRKHFIVYGRVTREEAVSILDEVFCLYPVKTVCFCNKAFDPDVIAIGRHPTYRLRATFLTMNTLDAFSLGRMEAGHAAAVIIFPVNEGFSSRVDDDVMLSSLIFERLVPQLPQYLWLRYGLHAHLLRGQQATVVDEHWKKYITATALLLPGIVPFLVNLVRTAWAEGDEPPTLWSDEGVEDWKSLYEYSRRNVISTCSVPLRFAKTSLREIVIQFKYTGVLIVGVEEYARKLMRLDLDYIVEEEDTLLAVYERSHNNLAVALELFAQVGPLEHNVMPQHGTHFWQTMGDARMQSETLNSSVVFYPFHTSADVTTNYGGAAQPPGDDPSRIADGASAVEIRRELSAQPFVEQHPHGVPLSNLIFSATNTHSLDNLMWRLKVASNGDYSTDIERSAIVTNLQDQINVTLAKMAQEYLAIVAEREQLFIDAEGKDDFFLFVDQTVSILRKSSMSVYEDIISQTIAQYELYVMMQCIRSVHVQSTLTLLTLRKYPREFLKLWKDIFGTPLRYLLGQGSLDSHLNYALNSAASASKIRGVLLYCSQMSPRDFGDVPLFSVENSVRDLLAWSEQYADVELIREHNIMVELQSFTSSIKVAPFHSNSEWRRRGEINFQDSLAFMMGHCFSSNMIQTLMVHCHRDTRISRFFEMTLNISSTAEMFDVSEWKGAVPQSKTLFKLCENQALQFQSYGEAFEFLISKKNSIAIGVFRLFPDSENLNGRPRYFVTNPPLAMPLLVRDIIYCLDGRDAPFGRLRKT